MMDRDLSRIPRSRLQTLVRRRETTIVVNTGRSPNLLLVNHRINQLPHIATIIAKMLLTRNP